MNTNKDRVTVILTIVLAMIFLILLVSFIFSRGGVMETIQKEYEVSQLKSEVSRMKKLEYERIKQLERLKNDEDYRRSIVKGLGFEAEENEYVFRFENKNKESRTDMKHQERTNSIATFLIALIVFQLIVFILIGASIILDVFKGSSKDYF